MTSLPAFAYTRRPVRVVFRVGAVESVRDEIERAGFRRPLIVATPGRSAVVTGLASALGGDLAGMFNRAALHVPSPLVSEVLAAVSRAGAASVVTIGGGSAIGLGKAIAHHAGLPVAAIPTTYSGSEMTEIWGYTDEDGKKTLREAKVAPGLVIYDPALTLDLSPATSAASGMNAAAHAVEALYAADANPISTLVSEEALRGLGRSLPIVIARPGDLPARTDALRAAHLAGVALDATSMGLHHKLAHVLGGTFGLSHAETHATLLPHVVAFNEPAAPEAMHRIAAAIGAPTAAEGIAALGRAVGITYGLGDLGLRREDIERAAQIAAATTYPNPRPVTAEAVTEILNRAY
jgi:alcohol dehydrogenase class IV